DLVRRIFADGLCNSQRRSICQLTRNGPRARKGLVDMISCLPMWRRFGAALAALVLASAFAPSFAQTPKKDDSFQISATRVILIDADSGTVLYEKAADELMEPSSMAKRARELGLTQSTFANSNGLPDPRTRVTARELAKLAQHIIRTYPDYYRFFGEREFTWNKIRQFNRNPLLALNIGADGMKTGF